MPGEIIQEFKKAVGHFFWRSVESDIKRSEVEFKILAEQKISFFSSQKSAIKTAQLINENFFDKKDKLLNKKKAIIWIATWEQFVEEDQNKQILLCLLNALEIASNSIDEFLAEEFDREFKSSHRPKLRICFIDWVNAIFSDDDSYLKKLSVANISVAVFEDFLARFIKEINKMGCCPAELMKREASRREFSPA